MVEIKERIPRWVLAGHVAANPNMRSDVVGSALDAPERRIIGSPRAFVTIPIVGSAPLPIPGSTPSHRDQGRHPECFDLRKRTPIAGR